jgi:hypothetical protein
MENKYYLFIISWFLDIPGEEGLTLTVKLFAKDKKRARDYFLNFLLPQKLIKKVQKIYSDEYGDIYEIEYYLFPEDKNQTNSITFYGKNKNDAIKNFLNSVFIDNIEQIEIDNIEIVD